MSNEQTWVKEQSIEDILFYIGLYGPARFLKGQAKIASAEGWDPMRLGRLSQAYASRIGWWLLYEGGIKSEEAAARMFLDWAR